MTAVSLKDQQGAPGWMSGLRWFLIVLVLAPVWLVQRDIWDGVIGTYGLERNDFAGIREWLVPSNWGLVYLLLRAIGIMAEFTGVPPWAWVKLLICASVIGLGREARLLARRVFGWDEKSSRFAELVVLTFPCWYVLYGSTFIYLVFIVAVFMGNRLMHEGTTWPGRCTGYGLLLLSFQVNSNFVMACALEATRWLFRDRTRAWPWRRSLLVIGSAIAIYLALRLIWAPSGPYQGYNNLVWPFSKPGFLAWVRVAAIALTWAPLLVGPAVAAWLVSRSRGMSPTAQGGFSLTEALGVGVLLAGALFAYMAVGKGAPLFVVQLPDGWLGTGRHLGKAAQGWIYTTADGWSMRNAFLFSLPAAIAITSIVRLVLTRRDSQRRAWQVALTVALVANLGWLANGHAIKLTRLAQEQAIVSALAAQPPPPPGTVDLELSVPVGWAAWTYEANYLFWLAYRQAAWAAALFGPDEAGQRAALVDRNEALSSSLPKAHFLMDQLPMAGCHSAYLVELPERLGAIDMIADSLGFKQIAPARLLPRERHCAQ